MQARRVEQQKSLYTIGPSYLFGIPTSNQDAPQGFPATLDESTQTSNYFMHHGRPAGRVIGSHHLQSTA